MGLMNYLRNRAGVVIVFCIGFAIVAFLLGDVISYGTPFWARNQNQVGNINGKAIDINEFNAHVDQTTEMFRQQMGGMMGPQMKTWAVEQVWSQFVSRELLNQEVEKIGLTIGKAELNDLVNGDNPSMQIVQAFTNPQTGVFDREQLMVFISQVKTLPSNHEAVVQWNALLDNVVNEQLNLKYNNLINNSVYVTSLEAKEDFVQRNKLANFDYVLLDYASVSDDAITITDADYKAFYDENRKTFFNNEETRTLDFVLFDASPVAQDTARVLENIKELAVQLAESTNDSLFAAVNSDTKYPFSYFKRGDLNTALDSALFASPIGSILGPVERNGVFEIAKVVDTKTSPDSIKASHILLNPALEGGVDGANAKADSIKRLIQSGESVAALAIQFSVDEGSRINGGELGTFPRGVMVPEFENAVFDAKRGDVLTVTSQFGVHIIKVEDVIGSSRVVKAAIVDKSVTSGKETIDAAYARATQFFSAANSNNFSEIASEQGVVVHTAGNVNARESMLQSTMVKRELVRWAFEAKAGEVSDKIYESENNDRYIVARVNSIQPEGQLPLDAVKESIELDVKNRVKAQKLIADANQASSGKSTLVDIAQALGKTPVSAENIVIANPIIPGVAMEPAVVGSVFGLEPNTPSKPVRGNQGVYLVEVKGFVNPEAPANLEGQKRQIQQAMIQRNWSQLFRALQDKAKIVDNRARFF